MDHENSSHTDQQPIEERLRLMTKAERKLWLEDLRNVERLRRKSERVHRRFLKMVRPKVSPGNADAQEAVQATHARYTALSPAQPDPRVSNMLTEAMRELDT